MDATQPPHRSAPCNRRRCIGVLVAAALCTLLPTLAAAAPEAEPWPRWEAHDPASSRRVDHSAWGAFLARYLVTEHPSGIHRLRYGAVSEADRAALAVYLERLQTVPVSQLARAEQKAYWINLYNALTVHIVLKHYPVDSIREISISGGLLGVLGLAGPWDAEVAAVEGVALSLNDIEHRILRPGWEDARIHYAVNCASLGCPDLAPEPYTAANTERLLEAGARAYVNHPRGARFEGDALRVSSIYVWFQADFGGDTAGVVRHLRHYAGPALAERLAGYRGDLEHGYDWRLNSP